MIDIATGDRVQIKSTPDYFKHKIGLTGVVVMFKQADIPDVNGFISDDLMISLDNGGFTFLQKKNLTKVGKKDSLT